LSTQVTTNIDVLQGAIDTKPLATESTLKQDSFDDKKINLEEKIKDQGGTNKVEKLTSPPDLAEVDKQNDKNKLQQAANSDAQVKVETEETERANNLQGNSEGNLEQSRKSSALGVLEQTWQESKDSGNSSEKFTGK